MNIGDVFFALRGDGGPLQIDAQKAAEAAGFTAGAAFKQKYSSVVKSALGSAIGAGAGLAFGAALTGANQLDAATRQLQADTGATAAEAKIAQKALAGMYRNNLQGFDAIGAAMAKVHNDLGLTGSAADAATAKFLKFSTATGQDAAAAVASFDDILDAWNLSAADAGILMDKLIVSHQKYGGVISESQSALAAMAPAMQAANMSIDDGIALLNLFNVAGIDASKAPAALAKAVKQLKPGQGLDDLIAQIGAIEDPTLRGQKAMEIFGAKSGIGMAQAIKPGMDSLDDLTASLGDTTDATTNAAAAIESGFGAQFKLLMKQAGGALAEFGLNFGELAMLASAFGPQFIRVLSAGLGGLAGLIVPRVVAAIVAAQAPAIIAGAELGAVTGTAIGVAIGPALALAIPAAILIGLQAIKPNIQKWLSDNGFGVPNLFEGQGALAPPVGLTPGTWETSPAGIAAAEARAKSAGAGVADSLAVGVSDGTARLRTAAQQAMATLGKVMVAGARDLKTPADQVAAIFGTTLVAGVQKAATRTGVEGMLALAAGISSARQKPLDAFETMVEMLKHPMTSTQEAARLAGELTSQALADGLRSRDPEVRAQAIAVKRSILDRLEELQTAKGIGGAAMDELVKGLKSKDPEIQRAAESALDTVFTGLEADAKARALGERIGSSFAAGVAFTSLQRFRSLEYPGLASGMPYVERTMPAIIHQAEAVLTVPQAEAWRAGQGGAREQHINIENVTIADAHDEFSLTQQLRFLASVG